MPNEPQADPATNPVASPTPLQSNEAAEVQRSQEAQDQDSEIQASPIDRALGYITNVDELKRYLEDAAEKHADLLNGCMKERGWENFHFPKMVPYSDAEFASSPYQRTEKELRRFGYGPVYNAAAAIEQASAYVIAAAAPQPTPDSSAPRLSDSERNARNIDIGECTDYAAEHAPRLPNRLPLPAQEIVFEFRASVLDSAPVQVIWEDWARCMAGLGHAYPNRSAVAKDLEQQAAAIHIKLSGGTPTSEDITQLAAQLDGLQETESRIVDADLHCSAETTVDERILEVLFAAEAEFVETEGDRLIAAAQS